MDKENVSSLDWSASTILELVFFASNLSPHQRVVLFFTLVETLMEEMDHKSWNHVQNGKFLIIIIYTEIGDSSQKTKLYCTFIIYGRHAVLDTLRLHPGPTRIKCWYYSFQRNPTAYLVNWFQYCTQKVGENKTCFLICW